MSAELTPREAAIEAILIRDQDQPFYEVARRIAALFPAAPEVTDPPSDGLVRALRDELDRHDPDAASRIIAAARPAPSTPADTIDTVDELVELIRRLRNDPTNLATLRWAEAVLRRAAAEVTR